MNQPGLTCIDMARSLANDINVAIIFAYTEDLAACLVSEAMKLENAPFVSGRGRVMDLIMRNGASTSGAGSGT